jgi:predicted DNA-binding transcriptional regulator AlpA
MTEHAELLSMAEIARIAGQSRSTVGNWKARNADFPAPASRTSRGPRYKRTEVEDWLRRTNRLPSVVESLSQTVAAFATDFGFPTPTAMGDPQDMQASIAFLALRQHCTSDEWDDFAARADDYAWTEEYIREKVPFADGVIEWQHWSPPTMDLWRIIAEVSAVRTQDMPKTIAGLIDAYAGTDPRLGSPVVPQAVRRLMAGLANPSDSDVIYQPGPGLAQTLVETVAAGETAQRLYVQELTDLGAALARVNIQVHKLNGTVASGDIFEADTFPELRADCVVCTPPWDPKVPQLRDTVDDPRWVWGEPGTNEGHFAWVQHCLYHLADGAGHAVILLPNSALVGRGRSARIRRRVIKAGMLRAVISLPPGAMPGSAVRASVLVFSRTPPEDDWGVLMVDMSDPAETFDAVAVKQTVDTYRDWIEGGESAGLMGAGATLEALAANDFVLDPARYQPIVTSTPSWEDKMMNNSKAGYRLEALLEEAHRIDERVKSELVYKK